MMTEVVGDNEVQIEEEDDEDEIVFELLEIVRLTSGDYSQICFAERFEDGKILVLEPADIDENWIFIVEKDEETNGWHDVEDRNIREKLLCTYSRNNRPDCMEVVE